MEEEDSLNGKVPFTLFVFIPKRYEHVPFWPTDYTEMFFYAVSNDNNFIKKM